MREPILPTAEQLARYRLRSQHPLTREWVDELSQLPALAEEHAFDLQLATDLDTAQKRAERMNVGQPPEAFLNRWVTISDDLDAMLSIRFKGLDVTKPFVDVSVTTRPVTEGDFPALLEVARQEYGAFAPRNLRLWSAAPAGAFAGTTPDMRLVAAPIVELRRRATPDELRLTPTLDLHHYPQALDAYAVQAARHPAHPEQASIQSEEDMLEAIEAGLMFDVLLNDIWSGHVGALPETKAGLPAYVVQEMLLTPQARGRGYGQFLSNLLARHLPDDSRVLLGDIHGHNLGAQGAAKAAGRQDIGGWFWVTL